MMTISLSHSSVWQFQTTPTLHTLHRNANTFSSVSQMKCCRSYQWEGTRVLFCCVLLLWHNRRQQCRHQAIPQCCCVPAAGPHICSSLIHYAMSLLHLGQEDTHWMCCHWQMVGIQNFTLFKNKVGHRWCCSCSL